jgi:hypothetical protein
MAIGGLHAWLPIPYEQNECTKVSLGCSLAHGSPTTLIALGAAGDSMPSRHEVRIALERLAHT